MPPLVAAGFEIASEAMQVLGGMGYTEEMLVEWCFRKCRGWMIAGGSIEILKNRIAEAVFERTFSQRPPHPTLSPANGGEGKMTSTLSSLSPTKERGK